MRGGRSPASTSRTPRSEGTLPLEGAVRRRAPARPGHPREVPRLVTGRTLAAMETRRSMVLVRGTSVFIRQFEVVAVDGPDRGKRAASRSDELSIGTAEGNDLRLTDPSVSRHHCALRIDERGLELSDLGSRNGTVFGTVELVRCYVQVPATRRRPTVDARTPASLSATSRLREPRGVSQVADGREGPALPRPRLPSRSGRACSPCQRATLHRSCLRYRPRSLFDRSAKRARFRCGPYR
jgi:hypothetical protein